MFAEARASDGIGRRPLARGTRIAPAGCPLDETADSSSLHERHARRMSRAAIDMLRIRPLVATP